MLVGMYVCAQKRVNSGLSFQMRKEYSLLNSLKKKSEPPLPLLIEHLEKNHLQK